MIQYFNGFILYPLLEKFSNRKINCKLLELNKFEKLSINDQYESQKKYLYDLLIFSQKFCPYYKKLFTQYQFDPSLILQDISKLSILPELTKQLVDENLHDIRQADSIHPRKTGGSTGKSVFFFYNNEGLDWTAAINLKCYEMAGKKPQHSDLHIGSDIDLSPSKLKDKIIQKIKLSSQNRTAGLLKSFSGQHLNEVLQLIVKTKPYLIQCHPSTLFMLALHIEKNEIKIRRPLFEVFEPTGEMLTDKIFNKVTSVLGCKIFNRYGNAEFGVVAHALTDMNFLELKVFDRAFIVENNDQGDLLVTGLTNYGMPLIRYNTGDKAEVIKMKDGYYIQNILGRVHDSVEVLGVKYPTHYIMDFLDHKVGGISEFQIWVEQNQKPTLNIILKENQNFIELKNKINQKWPDGFSVKQIDFSDLKQRGWRQKFSHVVDLRGQDEKQT